MTVEHLFTYGATDGDVILLTASECVLLDKLREPLPYLPQEKFPLVIEALERLGKLSAAHPDG